MEITDNSPSKHAGLLKNDIILRFNGKQIKNVDDLHKHLNEDKISAKSILTVIRGTKKVRLEIMPEELE